jgi:Nucleotidyl transferase AbiEii toxin, Type IV TA system
MLPYRTGSTRNADYMFPGRLDSPLIRPGVRLEMGIRGGTLPGTQCRAVTSYIADYLAAAGIQADYEELAPVQVNVIAPVRTLAEKLALLHHAGQQAASVNSETLLRAGRHFYDIYQLIGSAEVIAVLSAPGQSMAVLAADVDAKSAEFGWGHTARPADGYAASPVFDPAGHLRAHGAQAYARAQSLIWGERPAFDEVLARIASSADLL